MRITVNGRPIEIEPCTVFQLRDGSYKGTVTIVNGFATSKDVEMNDGDSIFFLDKKTIPNEKEAEMLMRARNSPEIHDKLKRTTVGIAGLGGLGSNIASMLTRTGIGHLILADMDIVDATNLNRQNYFQNDLGSPKTDATERILHQINPHADIECHTCRITPYNAERIFSGCDIVCEAFDVPEEKAMLINTILEKCPGTFVISGSGMAGYEDSNIIRTERKFNDLCLCGDGLNEARIGMGLMAPRVNICAGHMANAVIRHAMGLDI